MATMDVFEADGFSSLEMTAALNKQDYLPSFLGDMRLFEVRPIRTKEFAIEEQDGQLSLVQSSPRGAPVEPESRPRRTLRYFETVRLYQGSRITADEVQGIRAFGQENELMQVQREVADRQMRLRRNFELTWENMRLGAVQGIVTDADGSTIYDFFSQFGVSQPSEVNFALTTDSTDVQAKCAQIVRQMQQNAKGAWGPGSYVVGLCGDNFFDALVSHPEVREAYKYQQSQQLRANLAYQQVQFGGIRFVNYRGTDDGSTVSVGTDKVKFFPADAPGAFEVAFSPSEAMGYANTPGQPFYTWLVRDQERDMWVNVEMYSYPMFYPTRPAMLQRGKKA